MKRSERGARLPGVGLSVRGRRGGRAGRGGGVALLAGRRAARAAAAQRQRQPGYAGDEHTPPGHHSPSRQRHIGLTAPSSCQSN